AVTPSIARACMDGQLSNGCWTRPGWDTILRRSAAPRLGAVPPYPELASSPESIEDLHTIYGHILTDVPSMLSCDYETQRVCSASGRKLQNGMALVAGGTPGRLSGCQRHYHGAGSRQHGQSAPR